MIGLRLEIWVVVYLRYTGKGGKRRRVTEYPKRVDFAVLRLTSMIFIITTNTDLYY